MIKVIAEEEHVSRSPWSESHRIEITNRPPETPGIPNRPINGVPGTKYYYSVSSADPDGDKLYYQMDWGDGVTDEWYVPYLQGDEVEIGKTWSKKGINEIRVKVKDNE